MFRSVPISPATDYTRKLRPTDSQRSAWSGPGRGHPHDDDTEARGQVPHLAAQRGRRIGSAAQALAMAPDGLLLATADFDGRVRLWDWRAITAVRDLVTARRPAPVTWAFG